MDADTNKQKLNENSVDSLEHKKFNDNDFSGKEAESDTVELFHKVFQLYKPDEVLLSFNGGKDCTVVLHMLNTFIGRNECLKSFQISTLYITDPDSFEEIDEFVDYCENLYNINLIKKNGPIKHALKELCKTTPKLKAVFMGNRRTDPFCKDLNVMQMTDPGWPPLMRINPVLNWSCRQIWEYIYHYKVPYCKLYERGYTSIGNKKNTKPNPHLRIIDTSTEKENGYKHGNTLLDDELERAGRF